MIWKIWFLRSSDGECTGKRTVEADSFKEAISKLKAAESPNYFGYTDYEPINVDIK